MPHVRVYSEIPEGAESLVLGTEFRNDTVLYVCGTESRAQELAEQFSLAAPFLDIYYFPGWDCLPYDRVSSGLDVRTRRIDVLTTLLNTTQPCCVVTSVAALLQRLPPKDNFAKPFLNIKTGQTLAHDQLLACLTELGYNRTDIVRESGEYAVRGGIIDFYPATEAFPVRIDFFGDIVEHLRPFNVATQISSGSLAELTLKPVNELTLNSETISQFRTRYRELFGAGGNPLYEAISAGRKYGGMEHWLPLFFSHCDSLIGYMNTPQVVFDKDCESSAQSRLQTIQDCYQARTESLNSTGLRQSTHRPLPPALLYWTAEEWANFLNDINWSTVTPYKVDDGSPKLDIIKGHGKVMNELTTGASDRLRTFSNLANYVSEKKCQKKPVFLACLSEGSRDRLLAILHEHDIMEVTALEAWPDSVQTGLYAIIYPLNRGFELPACGVISEQDLLGDKVARVKSGRRKDSRFFLEAAQLTTGDLVVHADHGIGRYEGLSTVTVGSAAHDCLCLVYEGGDKLFLPVENIEMITRYGSDGAVTSLDRLGTTAWQMRKAKVKKRIREVADYLIKIAAERALQQGVVLEKHPVDYEEFCARFPYAETEDQQTAIEETLSDMASGKPMDRLVCGDVGFGKTEVALRAAFVAISQGKQVAIVVPTTLLCRQHYQTFQDRFRGFSCEVQQLSRFVKSAQAGSIRQNIAEGKVDVIVATHALLSDKVRFKDLGLLIIDEEHHFGVKQKEKLKKLAASVHVLTLTATPIPRTLQMALTGVRELSLITTPPVDRVAVRTYVMAYDSLTVREAIVREYRRGGQIFCVSPRLEDLQKWGEQLKKLVPEMRMAVAHGQMSATQLEDVMNAFYDRAYDVLLSTNIIESGIDIATANTLIVHRADLFGLAQLYQLRGRVGRGKVQGYAYLTLPEGKTISAGATKRLEVMQTLDNLGAGFNIASYDMDIRGTGNLVGEEQSGHIREVGVELYQHLLQEMILVVRSEQELGTMPDQDWTPQINLGASVLIPEVYVTDLNLRLGLYRRIAGLENRDQIDVFATEMIDRFGSLPAEVSNLFGLIEIKGLCRQAGIEKLDIGPRGALVSFKADKAPDINKLMAFIHTQKGTAKLRPDQKVIFVRGWDSLSIRMKGAKAVCTALANL
jgi:transcription-repair coupling factor (superfamily II helicase)